MKVATSFSLSFFPVVHYFKLSENESPCSVISCSLGEDPNVYFFVGTAFVKPDESEPTTGRILVFSVVDMKLKLVAETTVKGAVYSLNPFNRMLLASINSKVTHIDCLSSKSSRFIYLNGQNLRKATSSFLPSVLIRDTSLLCLLRPEAISLLLGI